jgi:PhoPQ-activated pathogenicity-related protein
VSLLIQRTEGDFVTCGRPWYNQLVHGLAILSLMQVFLMANFSRRFLFAAMVLVGYLTPARADLLDYVKKPDDKFSWKLTKKVDLGTGTVYNIHLVSQEWQGVTWTHELQVFLPKDVKPSATMFLWNQGGKPSAGSMAFGMDLAVRMKAPVAFLYGIPNQPLLDGKQEDALIAETFVRYLKTKDNSWPLLFPMVKSLVRAMDALQAFAKEEWKIEVTHFVVSGASKRGWTTWLTGAADARVKAIAPAVIDTLNFQLQIPHQLECFGKYSDMIKDYTERGLVPIPDTPEAKKLWHMIDPWHYRERLKMPVLIVNGANDPYWSTDALNLYWNDIKAPKWVLYVPNAGHGLTQERADGKKDRSRAIATLCSFAHCQIYDKELPKLTWKHTNGDSKQHLTIESSLPPRAARLWVATAGSKDFRKAQWKEQAVQIDKKTVSGEVAIPKDGYQAVFGELEFDVGGARYHLSTQMGVEGHGKKK